MRLTKDQKALLKAVREQDIGRVSELLNSVHPDFFPNFTDFPTTTPLIEAIKKDNLRIVRLLVSEGADVNAPAKAGKTPLDIAQEEGNSDILIYLDGQNAKFGYEVPGRLPYLTSPPRRKKMRAAKTKIAGQDFSDAVKAPAPEKEKKPVFKAETLAEVFEAAKWVGKVEEMQQHWEKVPKRLKKYFDFAAALTEARLGTIKNGASGKNILKKSPPPPSSPTPPPPAA